MHQTYRDLRRSIFLQKSTILICLSLTFLIIIEVIVTNRFFQARKNIRESSFSKGTVRPELTDYIMYEIASFGIDHLISLNKDMFHHILQKVVRDFLLDNLLNSKTDYTNKTQTEKQVTSHMIKQKALVNFYVSAICIIPRHGLKLCFAIFRTFHHIFEVGEGENSKALVFLTSFFLASFIISSYKRKSLRFHFNNAIVTKMRYVENIFQNFSVVKAFGMEEMVTFKYNFLMTKALDLELDFQRVSEYYRFFLRLPFIIPKILILFNSYYKRGIFHNINVRAAFHTISVLMMSTTELRSSLAYFIEFWNESNFGDNMDSTKQVDMYNNMDIIKQDKATYYEKDADEIFSSNIIGVNIQLLYNEEENNKIYDNYSEQGHGDSLSGEYNLVRSNKKLLEAEDYKPANLMNGTFGDKRFIKDYSTTQNNNRIVNLGNIVILAKKVNVINTKNSMVCELFLNMLLKNIDYKGSLTIGNVPFGNIEPKTFYKNISYMSNGLKLFKKSVLFNLAYGTGLSNQQILEKIKYMGFYDFISGFKDGFHTNIDEKGYGLSVGQRQVLCICRCLLKECHIYIFDSPSIFLDSKMKEITLINLLKLKDKTVIIFTRNNVFFDGVGNVINL